MDSISPGPLSRCTSIQPNFLLNSFEISYLWLNKRQESTVAPVKKPSLLCWMFLLALDLAQGQPAGFLRAKNARIINDQREIILRGMGLGGWMLQEGYMLGVRNEGTQHSIRARIADLIGKTDCDKFYQLWLQNHMSRADVDLLGESGFNTIRLPMHYNLFTPPIEEE